MSDELFCSGLEIGRFESSGEISALRAALKDCVKEMLWAASQLDLHPDDYFEAINTANALLQEKE